MNRLLALAALLTLSLDASAALVCADDYGNRGQWYVGQNADVALGAIADDSTAWCMATGAELAYIRSNFTGLRQHTTKGLGVTIWQGEDAAFILGNL